MTEIILSKGANTTLLGSDDVTGARFHVVLRWLDTSASCDVDVSVILLGSNGKVRSDDDLVFYNAPTGADGAVRLLGKVEGEDGSEDRVFIDLEALPDDIHQIAVAASVNDGAGFGSLSALSLAMLDSGGQGVLRYEITDATTETAFVFGEIYRRNATWKFRAVGQGWDSGLAGLATDYGIHVSEDDDLELGPGDDEGPGEQIDVSPDAAEDLVLEDLADDHELSGQVAADSLGDTLGPVVAVPATNDEPESMSRLDDLSESSSVRATVGGTTKASRSESAPSGAKLVRRAARRKPNWAQKAGRRHGCSRYTESAGRTSRRSAPRPRCWQR